MVDSRLVDVAYGRLVVVMDCWLVVVVDSRLVYVVYGRLVVVMDS